MIDDSDDDDDDDVMTCCDHEGAAWGKECGTKISNN